MCVDGGGQDQAVLGQPRSSTVSSLGVSSPVLSRWVTDPAGGDHVVRDGHIAEFEFEFEFGVGVGVVRAQCWNLSLPHSVADVAPIPRPSTGWLGSGCVGFTLVRTVVPDLDLARLKRWIDTRNSEMPLDARDQIRYEIDVGDRALTVVECRPPWRADSGTEWTRFPICRFRYTKTRGEWSLYWRDRNLKFHQYDMAGPTAHIEELIEEVVEDPTGIFWG